MRRFVSLGAGALVLGLLATPIASAQQSVNLYVGAFTLRGEDGRDRNDVLLNNLNFLAFNIKDFNGPTFGGEWLIGFGNNFEGSLGVGFSTRTVPTVYLNFVNTNGAEIEQDLKLRVVPFTATVRFLPLGRGNGIEPYIGGGVGVLSWHYSETGDFLANDLSIFRDSFEANGSTVGPLFLGGIRVPVGTWGLGFELRHQWGEGKIPADQDFAGTTIDLGGFTYNFTVHLRF